MTPFCKKEGNASLEYDLQLAYARAWGGEGYLAGGQLFLGRLLLSLGQKGEGVHTIRRLLGPLLQTAVSFWAAAVERRVSANVDFIVQLGTRDSLGLYPDAFPEPWFYTPPLSNK